jgi:N-methylhydantoinase A
MATGAAPWRVGIDTGGTFADLVVRPPGAGAVRTTKLPRDAGPERLAAALVELGVAGPALVVHGTTQVTNAVLEGRFARTALVTTRGFADVLRIGRQARDDLYDLARPARAAPIVAPELTFELDERCDPDGAVRVALDDAQLDELVRWVAGARVEAVAVCLLHAYANPEHERRVGAALGDGVAVSLSHEVSAEAREYERASATALNAAVRESTRAYMGELSEAIGRALPEARLFVVQSSGGMVPTEVVGELPLRTVMSGPAAGVAAVCQLARRTGLEQAVAFDMGGTSTDVAFVLDGTPAIARQRHVGGHVVRSPAVAVESIAVGGGSIVALDDVGALVVGPRSAGATPGPAAYGRGGTEPTITDAALVCGLIGAGGDAPGLALRRDLAERALAAVADRMGIGVDDLAWRAVDVAQGLMDHALRTIVTRRGYDLRACTLVAYGGGGPVHAGPLAARAGIPRVLVPPLAPVLSALGCCLAEVGMESVRGHRCPLAGERLGELEAVAAELVAAEARSLGAELAELRVTRRLELRYRGQNAELPVAWPPGADAAALRNAFAAAHEQEYGFATDDPIEVTAVSCRVEVAGEQGWPSSVVGTVTPPATTSLLLPGGERREVPVVASAALADGRVVAGPAILAAPFGSITVWTEQRARADEDGNVVLEADTESAGAVRTAADARAVA